MNNENLKPCKPGETHNPNGRPKGAISMTTRLKKMLKQKIKNYDPLNKSEKIDNIRNHLVNIWLAKALSGEDKSMMEIINRTDGKAQDNLNLTGNISIDDLDKIMGEWFGSGNKTNTKAKNSDESSSDSSI